jgi:phosphatidylglycerol:prolipoprotein diacylglycerol transferase
LRRGRKCGQPLEGGWLALILFAVSCHAIMHRILLSSPVIGTYSFCLLLGLISGYLLARRNARRLGMERRHIDNITLLVAITGLAGARIFSWLFYFPPGFTLWQALWQPGGGLVFYGGVVGGFAGAIVYCLVRRVQLRNVLDVLAAPLAVGLAFGRIGCFMAGCCWGDVCVDQQQISSVDAKVHYQINTLPVLSPAKFPLAVRFPLDTGALNQQIELGLLPPNATQSLPVHPVQLYESSMTFLLAYCLQRKFRRRRWAGEVLCWFCGGYGLIRFAMEFLRADNPPIYFGLTLSQVISLICLAACGILLAAHACKSRPRTEVQTGTCNAAV